MKSIEQHAGCRGGRVRATCGKHRVAYGKSAPSPRPSEREREEREREREGERGREGEREREGREIRRHPLRQGVPVLPAPPPRALQQGAEVPI